MLKYPCLVLDHDDTVVQSEKMVNFPYFQYILDKFRPGATVSMQDYTEGCFHLGFADMCRKWYGFTEQELVEEYEGWKVYIRSHVPAPFPGVARIIQRQKQLGGRICVVSHSCEENITRDYQTHFGILPDAIFGWDLPEALRKPSSYSLEQIMSRFGFQASELLVVDDMKLAWEMASPMGVKVAFAAWGRQDFPELTRQMKALCDYSFDTPSQLEHFLFDDLTDMV